MAAAALKTPMRNGYNAQGVNLTFCAVFLFYQAKTYPCLKQDYLCLPQLSSDTSPPSLFVIRVQQWHRDKKNLRAMFPPFYYAITYPCLKQ